MKNNINRNILTAMVALADACAEQAESLEGVANDVSYLQEDMDGAMITIENLTKENNASAIREQNLINQNTALLKRVAELEAGIADQEVINTLLHNKLKGLLEKH